MAACRANQLPLEGNFSAAITAGLPAFSEVVPAMCNDFHKGGTPDACVYGPAQDLSTRADAWLQSWVPAIMAGPDWQAGRLAILIVWDEGSGADIGTGGDCTNSSLSGCHIPLLVLSPATSHVVDGSQYTLYSVLRTTEEILGLPLLGKAATANSMRAAFGLGAQPPPTTTSSSTPPDTIAPTGAITSPTAGATVSGKVGVTLTASDNVGVVKINLLVDGVFFASDFASPYTFTIDTTKYANRSHTLFAKI